MNKFRLVINAPDNSWCLIHIDSLEIVISWPMETPLPDLLEDLKKFLTEKYLSFDLTLSVEAFEYFQKEVETMQSDLDEYRERESYDESEADR